MLVLSKQETRYSISSKKANKLLGGKCIFCGSRTTLQRHHIKYDKYYPKKRKVNGKWVGYRLNPVYEALKRPEDFRLLCPKCHNVVTYGLLDTKRTKLVFKKMGEERGFDNNTVKKIIAKLGKV